MSPLALAAALIAGALTSPPGEAGGPVVLVSGGDRFGSGVVWDAEQGLVLTALHVVERMEEIRLTVPGEAPQAARLVDVDARLDLALVRAESGRLGGAARSARAAALPRQGEAARLVGYPGGTAAAAAGTILEPSRRFAGASYLAVGVRAGPGASGGPVLDARGEVVGIVDLVLTGPGITLAVPVEAALARFPRAGRPPGRLAAE